VVGLAKKAIAIIRLTLPSDKFADILYSALQPETKSTATYRSKVNVELEGLTIVLSFKAGDTAALRASLNSYLSWLHLLTNIYEVVTCHKHER
jgi:KEOPS complex subunit Pcc1